MTGTNGKSAYPSRHVKHIGVICGRGGITPAQRER
jgi:hypothetical protein